tara:strand:+ start:61 stop:1197 length:1137 start_codon:yes stop_codon:yes gene_type:complete
MKKIIYRKISFSLFGFFILASVTISTIIWIIQAVNFLDVVVEDGHSFKVYFSYSILNFPKIFSKIIPFTLFLSFFYTLIKYERNNELIIFWTFGINKLDFLKFFIKVSFIFVLIQIILTTYFVPKSQDMARSFIRNSDIDSFESIIKQKKFIDALKNLTIFVDNINEKKELNNFFLKDTSESGQITFSKKGAFEIKEGRKILSLYDGKTIKKNSTGKINIFEFSRTEINMSKFNTTTTSLAKTQENTTFQLINCVINLKKQFKFEKDINKELNFNNCRLGNLSNINQELYKRIILPFYLPVLIVIACFIIIKSKDQIGFSKNLIKVFIFGISTIILSEVSLNVIGKNDIINLSLISSPIIFFYLIYYSYKKMTGWNVL